MELTQLLKERRTVQSFQDREVSPELIMELLETSVWVPNYHMTQPWRFIVVHGEGRQKIAAAIRSMKENGESDPAKKQDVGQKFYDKLMSVPMYVVVVMKEDVNLVVREEDYASTSCIIHNFSLLAWEKGLGLVWQTYPLLYDAGFREALQIQPGEKVVGNLHIGYPAAVPAAKTRIPAAELTTVFDQA
ncbi:nitroreductase family protein [Paenibacillus sp. 481]|uniref:nitroreductase family protein n=1 Tax=Paenibacillus sp. 481 TaxID=2835869 RepID=UPI001E36DE2C|nr:nitroreductase [Paenibacillus sp. 481]UHA74839.1 nitroreductase [Paenibacillus sp. 481]